MTDIRTDVVEPLPEPPPPPVAPVPPPADGSGFLRRVFRATEEENRRAVLRALAPSAGGRLLDIGTHEGAFTARMVERVRPDQVTGIDDGLHLTAELRLLLDVRSEHVAGGHLGDAERRRDAGALGSLAGTLGPDDEQAC